MPSFHFAWAVLLARSLGGARLVVRLIGFAFVAATALATIGSGEHYVIDLIVAAPFVVALEAATAHRSVAFRSRLGPLLVGTSIFAFWIIVIRAGSETLPVLERWHPLFGLVVTVSICLPMTVSLKGSRWRNEVGDEDMSLDSDRQRKFGYSVGRTNKSSRSGIAAGALLSGSRESAD